MNVESVDWQSLTFVGERHRFQLRIAAPQSYEIVGRLCTGLEDAEFSIPGLLVADIAIVEGPARAGDDSTSVTIEALTIGD